VFWATSPVFFFTKAIHSSLQEESTVSGAKRLRSSSPIVMSILSSLTMGPDQPIAFATCCFPGFQV
jgi:hypothetical protein